MELTQLRHFATVASTENMSQAARILFISQPALSYSLKKLEKELGAELFDRTGNSISLNENGREALRYAETILNASAELSRLFVPRTASARSLSVYSSSVPAIRHLLPRFITSCPEINVTYRTCEPAEAARALTGKKCDIAFTTEPIRGDSVHNMPFCRDDMMAYIHKDHPLYGRRKIHVQDLNGMNVLCLSDDRTQSALLRRILGQSGLAIHQTYIEDYPIYRSMLQISKDVGFVSSLAAPYFEKLPDRSFVMIADKEAQMTLYFSYLRENEKKLDPFFSWIRKDYKNLLR